MPALKMYKDKFTNDRRLAWIRSVCQARYRKEDWDLTFAEFCQFWNTETRFRQRGRSVEALVLVRIDDFEPWNRNNCAILKREQQLSLAHARRYGKATEEYFKDAIRYGQ